MVDVQCEMVLHMWSVQVLVTFAFASILQFKGYNCLHLEIIHHEGMTSKLETFCLKDLLQ